MMPTKDEIQAARELPNDVRRAIPDAPYDEFAGGWTISALVLNDALTESIDSLREAKELIDLSHDELVKAGKGFDPIFTSAYERLVKLLAQYPEVTDDE